MSTKYFGSHRPDMLPFIPSSVHKVLDVGCGHGNFRQHFAADCEYWGIEMSKAAAEHASESLHRVINADVNTALSDLPDQYFDLIVCNDVIEHLADTDQFLTDIKQKLTPNGVLIGSIPNVRYFGNLYELLVLKDWRYRDAGIMDRTHLRFFTEKSLQRTFQDNGYSIEMMHGVSGVRPKQWYKQVVLKLIELVLGADSRAAQFGFKIQPI